MKIDRLRSTEMTTGWVCLGMALCCWRAVWRLEKLRRSWGSEVSLWLPNRAVEFGKSELRRRDSRRLGIGRKVRVASVWSLHAYWKRVDADSLLATCRLKTAAFD